MLHTRSTPGGFLRAIPLASLMLLAATGLQAQADTVSADSLLRKLPADTRFEVMMTLTDTVPGLFVLSEPPQPAELSLLAKGAPNALMWLVGGRAKLRSLVAYAGVRASG